MFEKTKELILEKLSSNGKMSLKKLTKACDDKNSVPTALYQLLKEKQIERTVKKEKIYFSISKDSKIFIEKVQKIESLLKELKMKLGISEAV